MMLKLTCGLALLQLSRAVWHPMPNGRLMHEDCIHQFDDDFHVDLGSDGTSTVTFSDGRKVHHAPCPYEMRDAEEHATVGNLGYYSGWAADAHSAHLEGIGQMANEWVVPQKPTSQGPLPPLIASSVYIFNGLEDGMGVPGKSNVILQPVLQYGKSGCLLDPTKFGDWYFTSYLVTDAGRAYCGPNVGPVQEGETILGNMTLVDADTQTWAVESTRLKTGDVSRETASVGKISIDTAYLALEMMVCYACDAYPASGSETFQKTTLANRSLKPLTPSWAKNVRHTECDQDVTFGSGPFDPISIVFDPTKKPNTTVV